MSFYPSQYKNECKLDFGFVSFLYLMAYQPLEVYLLLNPPLQKYSRDSI